MILVTKRVAVAPFELKLGANESYGRAASVKPPPGAKKAQIRGKIIVQLQGSAAWARPLKLKVKKMLNYRFGDLQNIFARIIRWGARVWVAGGRRRSA